MVVLGMDYAAWSDTYRMAQYVLGYYKTKGLVPEGKLFTSGVEVWERGGVALWKGGMEAELWGQVCMSLGAGSRILCGSKCGNKCVINTLRLNHSIRDVHQCPPIALALPQPCSLSPTLSTPKILFMPERYHSRSLAPRSHNLQDSVHAYLDTNPAPFLPQVPQPSRLCSP